MAKSAVNRCSMRKSIQRFNGETARKFTNDVSNDKRERVHVDAEKVVVQPKSATRPKCRALEGGHSDESLHPAARNLSINSRTLRQLFEALELPPEALMCPEKNTLLLYCDLRDRLIDANGEQLLLLNDKRKKLIEPNFELKVYDAPPIKCHLAVLRAMCGLFNISAHWQPLPSLDLDAASGVLCRLLRFLYMGSIQIGIESLEDFMYLGDFLACEGLLKTCVQFLNKYQIPADVCLRVHSRFPHVPGVSDSMIRALRKFPMEVLEGKHNETLGQLSTLQMKTLLSSDDLQLRSEDDAVKFLMKWIRVRRPVPGDIRECLNLVREPFISCAYAEILWTGFFRTFRFPKYSPIKHRSSIDERCNPRSRFDRHIHLLWRGPKYCHDGNVNLTVTCARWTVTNELLEEKTIITQRERRLNTEDTDSIEYVVEGNSIIRLSYNKSRNRIFVVHTNFATRRAEVKQVIDVPVNPSVHLPDFTAPKNYPTCAVSYFNVDKLSPQMKLFNTTSWQEEETFDISSIPCQPREFEMFADCTVVISCKSVFILNGQCKQPTKVEMPKIDGNLVDFARVSDNLFVLEDNSADGNNYDRIHYISISLREFKTSASIDYRAGSDLSGPFYQADRIRTRRLLRINSDIYVLSQEDSIRALAVSRFNPESKRCEPAVRLKPPESNILYQESLNSRSFMCEVPIRICPCNHAQLRHC